MKLVIYAHFDPENEIKPYVVYLLDSLLPFYDKFIFVTCSVLDAKEQEKIRHVCTDIRTKDNIGYDFAMWKHVIQTLDLDAFDEITLVNSSFYGPVFDIRELFSHMATITCDFWGVTESYEHDRHLQSYFLVLKRNVIRSPVFREFWNSVLEYRNKFQVIRSYEIGFTQWLLEQGFTLGVYCPWKKLVRYRRSLMGRKMRQPCNPSIKWGLELLKLRSPFVKIELMRDNPANLPLKEIRRLMSQAGYPEEYLTGNRLNGKSGKDNLTMNTCQLCCSPGKAEYPRIRDRFLPFSSEKWRIWRCDNKKCGIFWLSSLGSGKGENIPEMHDSKVPDADYVYFPPRYNAASRALLRVLTFMLSVLGLEKARGRHDIFYLDREKPGRLLEVGCGWGDRLVALRKLGWETEGFETDPDAVAHCRDTLSLTVHGGTLSKLNVGDDRYDVVLMSHVIEHVHDPAALLMDCLSLLKPGGKLILTTPNVRSLCHLLYNKYFYSLDPPRHRNIFTPSAIKRLLRESGYENISLKTTSVNSELVSLHSRDIRFVGWTDPHGPNWSGKELVPVIIQTISLFTTMIFPSSGEECILWARRPNDR